MSDHPLSGLARATPARVDLGRVGVSLPTSAVLAFALAHARARDAVHSALDVAGVRGRIEALGCRTLAVDSAAGTRAAYLARPDLGRRLSPESDDLLRVQTFPACDVAIVLGDGLSAAAIETHAIPLLAILLPRLAARRLGPMVIATQARVALGDAVGMVLRARLVLVLIGERPGLSSPDSLGAYLTLAPSPTSTDADRNCVSNIHAQGLGYDEAAFRIAWLIGEAFARGLTGVALKDESGAALLR